MALQERARLRREAKRELATLHRALASTEKPVPRASPSPSGLPSTLPLSLALPSSENRSVQSSVVGAFRDSDDARDRATQLLPLGARNLSGGVDVDDSGNGSGNGNFNGSGNRNENSNGDGNGSGSGNGGGNDGGSGNGNGSGNGSGSGNGNGIGNDVGSSNNSGNTEDALGVDNSYWSNASRGELLVRMGLVRARLGGGNVAGDGRLRPVAESLRREVEELGRSSAGANRTAGE